MKKSENLTNFDKNEVLKKRLKIGMIVYIIIMTVLLYLLKHFQANIFVINALWLFFAITAILYVSINEVAKCDAKVIDNNNLVILALSKQNIVLAIGLVISLLLSNIFSILPFEILNNVFMDLIIFFVFCAIFPIFVSNYFDKKIKW